MVFSVKMRNVIVATDSETTHRTLTMRRAIEVYEILLGTQEGNVMPITLCHMKYKISVGTNVDLVSKKIYFDCSNHIVEDFEEAFRKYGEGTSSKDENKVEEECGMGIG